jgi:hypothetical protein
MLMDRLHHAYGRIAHQNVEAPKPVDSRLRKFDCGRFFANIAVHELELVAEPCLAFRELLGDGGTAEHSDHAVRIALQKLSGNGQSNP